MPFPTTPVLDNCARADENPLSHGGDWTNVINPGDFNGKLATNVITSAGGGWFSAYWNRFTAADVEVYGNLAATGSDFRFWYRVANPNSGSLNGYRANFQPNAGSIVLEKVVANAFTTLTTLSSLSITRGVPVGVQMIGNAMTFWVNGAQVGSFSDSSISAVGFIGVEAFFNTGDGYTSFGGGPLVTGQVRGPDPMIRR